MNLQAETTKPRRTWNITSADDRRGNHEEMAQTTEVGKRDPAEVEIKETRGGPRGGRLFSSRELVRGLLLAHTKETHGLIAKGASMLNNEWEKHVRRDALTAVQAN